MVHRNAAACNGGGYCCKGPSRSEKVAKKRRVTPKEITVNVCKTLVLAVDQEIPHHQAMGLLSLLFFDQEEGPTPRQLERYFPRSDLGKGRKVSASAIKFLSHRFG